MTSTPAHPDHPRDVPREPAPQPRLELSGTQVLASGLASLTAAVVTSFFGVAGTVIGAAVVGIVWTLGSAVYRYWIGRTQIRLQQARPIILRPRRGTGHPDAAGDRTVRDLDQTGRATIPGVEGGAPAPPATAEHHPGTSPRRWWAWLSRRRIGVALALVIVLVFSLAVITVVELVAREPMSGITGGDPSGRTSIDSLFDGGDDDGGPGGTSTTTTGTTAGPTTTSERGIPPGAPAPTTTAPSTGEGDIPTTTEEQSTTTTTTTTSVPPPEGE
ncbi:MAG: hypothetical protein ACLFXM_00815 [Acidimicrobiia bacterium]